jgi:subtilase family serine protease
MLLRNLEAFRVISWTLIIASFGAQEAQAQSSGQVAGEALPRITQRVDETSRMTLDGNIHPLARPEFDLGPIPDSFAAGSTLLVFRRSEEQELALRHYIEDIHNPASPSFHKWLTPAQIGSIYGPAESDIQQVISWLQSHGLQVSKVNQARTFVRFSGTAGQIRDAFHTSIRQYLVHGELHHANSTNPQIPLALTPVVAGIATLNDFYAKPALTAATKMQYNSKANYALPEWTIPDGYGHYSLALAPGDFDVQYNIPSSATGAGVTIGIIDRSNVDLNLVMAYRTLFALNATNLPNIIVDGGDPGILASDSTESYLDLEVAGAVAPSATINQYLSASSVLSDGLADAALRAVEDNAASVLSMSYLECESQLGSSGNQTWNQIWEQAAAQGQTVMVSAGDSGSASCDNHDTATEATHGLAVNGRGSTPFNIMFGKHGINYLAEIKDGSKPPSARKLTDDEVRFHVEWRGKIHILESVQDVIDFDRHLLG